MTKEEFDKFKDDYEVCSCMGVELGEIKKAIKDGCDTIEDIMDQTDAGTACQKCQSLDKDDDTDKDIHLDEILKFSK
jgi:NAD(P)H-nitrite reductase large subunit